MLRVSRMLLFMGFVGLVGWGMVQAACSPPEPCKLCRSDELCDGTKCVPLPPLDGGSQDGKVGDSTTGDTISGDIAAPPPDRRTTGCTSDDECEGRLICKDNKCVSPEETTMPDGAGGDTPPADRPDPRDGPAGDTPPVDQVTGDGPPADRVTPEGPVGDRVAPDAPQCTVDSDCASTHECKSGKCERKPAPCDPACPTGATCTGGKCERAGSTPDLGELCGPNSKCKAGLTCLETDRTSSYCLQPCTESKDCTTNALGKVCIQLTQTQRFCVDVVKVGDKCGFIEKLQALCPSGAICSEGTCKKPQEVRRYDKCGINAQVCPTKMICLRFSGAKHGYCVDPCTPGAANTCPDKGTCTTLSGGTGACIPSGTGKHDTLCGGSQEGAALDRGKICEPGLDCVQLNQAVCMEFWTGDCKTAGKTCPAGRICQSLRGGGGQNFGACFSQCNSGACSAVHLECRTQSNDTCWPKTP